MSLGSGYHPGEESRPANFDQTVPKFRSSLIRSWKGFINLEGYPCKRSRHAFRNVPLGNVRNGSCLTLASGTAFIDSRTISTPPACWETMQLFT